MNRYGRMARHNYRSHLPDRLAAMADPASYFTRLGEQAQAAVTDLRDRILGAQRPGESPAGYRSRGRQAFRQAEEIALAELLTLPPAHEEPDSVADPELESYRSDLALINDQLSRLAADWTTISP